MTAAIVPFEFEGVSAHVYAFRGRPCMLAPEVGAALAYSETGFRSCFRDWQGQGEVKAGEHFDVLRGADLEEFRALAAASADSALASRATQITVIYEAGLHMVCLLSKKPLGQRLRQALAEKVLPRLARGEAIPAARPNSAVEAAPASPALMPDASVRAAGRAIELALKSGKINEEVASLKYAQLAKASSGYDVTAPTEGLSWQAAVPAAIAALKPGQSAIITVPVDTTDLRSAESIAREYGVTAHYVGKLARELGIFGKEGLGAWTEVRVNGALKNHNWAYAGASVEQMAGGLEAERARRKAEVEAKAARVAEKARRESVKGAAAAVNGGAR